MIYVCLFTSFAALASGNLIAGPQDWKETPEHDHGLSSPRWLVEITSNKSGIIRASGKEFRVEVAPLGEGYLLSSPETMETTGLRELTAVIGEDGEINARIEVPPANGMIRYQQRGECTAKVLVPKRP